MWVRHTEYSIKFLQITDLLLALQVTLTIDPSSSNKREKNKEEIEEGRNMLWPSLCKLCYHFPKDSRYQNF